ATRGEIPADVSRPDPESLRDDGPAARHVDAEPLLEVSEKVRGRDVGTGERCAHPEDLQSPPIAPGAGRRGDAVEHPVSAPIHSPSGRFGNTAQYRSADAIF